MSNNLNNPRDYDAVLGDQSPAPINAAVLGGIKGVKLRLSSQLIEHRMRALSDALNYGEEGLKLVIRALDDSEDKIRKLACRLLKSQEEPDVKAVIDKYVQQLYFLRFDGLYCTSIPAKSTWRILRFYQDGTVFVTTDFSTKSNLHEFVAEWLNYSYSNRPSRDTYKIEINRLNLSVTPTYMDDVTGYWGEIGMYGNTITLRRRRHNKHYKYSKTYYFAHIPNIV